MLVRRPLNAAVVQGSVVTFECTTLGDVNSSRIEWHNSTCVTTSTSISACAAYLIYSGYMGSSVPPRYSVTRMNNATHLTRDLSINQTQLTDAGVYLCTEETNIPGINESSSAQLVVFGNYIS